MEISDVFCDNNMIEPWGYKPGGNVTAQKPTKSKFNFPVEVQQMTQEEAKHKMAEFFQKLEEEFKNTPPEEIEAAARKFERYMKGQISWAELMNLTPETLLAMANFGYQQFKLGRYPDAERVFKVLTVLDWNNAYYHSMMGSILQRQKRFGEAIAEYNEAIELNPRDIVSFTHRGEIYLLHGLVAEAKADLEKAVKLDTSKENQWAERAQLLLQQIEKQKGK